jgi:hypothetical protein
MSPKKLPQFMGIDGYTIDTRLRQFRKVSWKKGEPRIEFIDFDSVKGRTLLAQLRKTI